MLLSELALQAFELVHQLEAPSHSPGVYEGFGTDGLRRDKLEDLFSL